MAHRPSSFVSIFRAARALFPRLVTPLLFTLAAALVAAFAPAGASGSEEGPPLSRPDARPGALGPELPSKRTRTSRTYASADGRGYVTKVSRDSLHFKEGGAWRTIDNDLVASSAPGYAAENGANRYRVRLPDDLGAAPVRVESDGASVGFRLDGAAAPASVDGDTATYDVRPGVTATYTAQPDAVKETMVLENAASPSRYEFDLELSDGLRPRENGRGGIDFLNAAGQKRFAFAPPFMYDSSRGSRTLSRAVTLKLERDGDGQSVVLSADRDWLQSEERRFPVTIDPTLVVTGGSQDCPIYRSTPDDGYCGGGYLDAGWDGQDPVRSLLRFDVSSIPNDAQVLNAELGLTLWGEYSNAAVPFSVRRVTSPWNGGATWSTRDGSAPWSSSGGDFDAVDAPPDITVGGTLGGYSWYPTRMVQGWVDGSSANHGLVLKAASESGATDSVKTFADSALANGSERPTMTVKWKPRIGIQRQFTYEEQELSDRANLRVNVGNGNLVLEESDLQIAGTGLDLELRRTYNSLGDLPGSFGRGFTTSLGDNVGLTIFDDGSAGFYGEGYAAMPFIKQGESFVSPTGIDARLVQDADGGYTMTFNKTGERWRFGPGGPLTHKEDRNGNRVTVGYAGDGRLSSITDTQGRVVDVDMNGDFLIEGAEDVAGRGLSYVYDYDGRLTSYTNPDGEETEYGWNGAHDLVRYTSPGGAVTKLAYDSKRRVTQITRVTNLSAETGPTTTFAYNAGSTVVTDPRGKQTTYHYDRQLRVTRTIDAKGHERSQSYTANSNVQSFTDGTSGPQTAFGYDGLDNLTSVGQPAGEQSSAAYGDSSHPYQPTSATSPSGTQRLFTYDTPGNVRTVADASPSSVQASLEYNGQSEAGQCPDDPTTKPGTLRCAVDGKGNRTLYEYDDQGNLTRIVPPPTSGPSGSTPLGATTLTYDSLSRLKTATDGRGTVETYGYDALDRLTSIDYSNGESIDYQYDAHGNQTKRIDSVHGTTTYSYDALNRRTGDAFPGGVSNSYAYDAASNLTSVADLGGTVSYAYDSVNRVSSLTDPGGLVTSFGYDVRDNRTSTSFPNGVVQSQTYDGSDKLKLIEATKGTSVLTRFAYDYRSASQPGREQALAQAVTERDGSTTTHGYDALDRLVSAMRRGSGGGLLSDRSWAFDAASNRTRQVVDGQTTSYAYNAANQVCWQASGSHTSACGSPPSGATGFRYDANGNETLGTGGRTSGYSVRDQLVSLTPPGGSAISFAYAGPGQTERTADGGAALRTNLLGTSGSGASHWTRDPSGGLVSQRTSSARHYYLRDRIGTVVGVTDSSGNLAASYRYDPYGNTLATTGTVTNPWRFAGEYRQNQTNANLYKIGARYYDPTLGRWTQQDPLDQAGDLREANRYIYAGADPVNLIDPSGTHACGPLSDICDTANDFAGEVQAVYNDVRSTLRTRGGSLARNCAIGGFIGGVASRSKEGAALGCVGYNLYRRGR